MLPPCRGGRGGQPAQALVSGAESPINALCAASAWPANRPLRRNWHWLRPADVTLVAALMHAAAGCGRLSPRETSMPKTVKCAKCLVEIEGSGTQDDDVFKCPTCGESDTYKNIMAELAGNVARNLMLDATEPLGELARRNPRNFTYTPGTRTPPRFIVD
jgi:hypothetical protein